MQFVNSVHKGRVDKVDLVFSSIYDSLYCAWPVNASGLYEWDWAGIWWLASLRCSLRVSCFAAYRQTFTRINLIRLIGLTQSVRASERFWIQLISCITWVARSDWAAWTAYGWARIWKCDASTKEQECYNPKNWESHYVWYFSGWLNACLTYI